MKINGYLKVKEDVNEFARHNWNGNKNNRICVDIQHIHIKNQCIGSGCVILTILFSGILSLYCMLTLVEKGRTLIELHGLIICKKVSYWVNWLYVGIVIFFVLYTCEARRQYGEQINIYEIYGIVCLVGPRIIMDQNSFFNYLEELSRSSWKKRFRYISSWNRGDAFVILNEQILTKVQVNFIFLIIGISCIIQSLYLTQINEKLQQNLMMKTGLLSKDAVVGLI
ncbi:hypothetical protein ACTFIY_004507, partial [Dictyostelium cf. discoideum]